MTITAPDSTAPARWIPGALFAVETDTPPDAAICDSVSPEVWQAFRRFGSKYDLDVTTETAFADLDAISADVFHAAGLEFARDGVLRFIAEEYSAPLPDPEVVGDAMHAARSARFQAQHKVDNALRDAGVSPGTRYSLAEVERVCGPEIAAAARGEIDGHNAEVWDTPKPHRLTERVLLAAPADLVGLGATTAQMSTMIPATREDRRAAKRDVALARRRYALLTERRARTADRGNTGLTVLSVAELAALTPPTPLVDGLLYRSTSAQLAGRPGTGKTFAALGMSCALATGHPWSGHQVPEAMPVVYVAAEGSPYARAAAWCEVNGVDPVKLDGMLHVIPESVQLGDDDQMSELREVVTRVGAGLVVFDTRAKCTVGLEENSATDQGVAIGAVDDLIAATSTTVLAVHHLGVNSTRGRGSTAWDGAVYSSLILSRDNDGVTIRCDKHKDVPDGCEHPYSLDAHTVSPALMTEATMAQRGTLVMVAADPMAMSDSAEAEMNDTCRRLLALIAETAGPDGLPATRITAYAAERGLFSTPTSSAAQRYVRLLHTTGRTTNVGTLKRPRYTVTPPKQDA